MSGRAWANAPYVRIYATLPRDYPTVWRDPTALGTYVRLLHVADAMYPAPAPLPRRVDDRALEVLTATGLVRIRDDDNYEIAGLRAERESRAGGRAVGGRARAEDAVRDVAGRFVAHHQSSQHPASKPQQAPATAGQQDPAVQLETETETETEPSLAREGLAHITPAVAEAWEQATGRSVLGSGLSAQSYLDDASRRHGAEKVAEKIDEARQGYDHIPEVNALASTLRQLLDPFKKAAETQRQEAEHREAVRSQKARESTMRTIHNQGGHEGAPDPRCPLCREVDR